MEVSRNSLFRLYISIQELTVFWLSFYVLVPLPEYESSEYPDKEFILDSKCVGNLLEVCEQGRDMIQLCILKSHSKIAYKKALSNATPG